MGRLGGEFLEWNGRNRIPWSGDEGDAFERVDHTDGYVLLRRLEGQAERRESHLE